MPGSTENGAAVKLVELPGERFAAFRARNTERYARDRADAGARHPGEAPR